MTDEIRHEPHEKIGFERQDLSSQAVFAFLISLAVGGVLVYFVVLGLYRYLDAYQRAHQPPPNPLVQQTDIDTRVVSPNQIRKFSEPRLETNERSEINDFRLKEEQILNSYGWVNEKDGIVHIPIERAIQLIAKQGLPTTPKAGTVPPSEVNVVNQAARRSDTSKPTPAHKKKD